MQPRPSLCREMQAQTRGSVWHSAHKSTRAHGIQGNYSRWIRNWLSSRAQRVMIHDQASDLTHVPSRVPQGSVLGPLLFIIYINDLDVGFISKINKYAEYMKFGDRAFTKRQSHFSRSSTICYYRPKLDK
ncbi:Reverse transcriptase domain [Trinorchestia longiramus]|nr:Reverse transcriptase domain [Trinorchestia longiramus]